MNKIFKKTSLIALTLIMFFAIGIKNSEAASYTPVIIGNTDIKSSSLSLRISCAELKKKKVDVKVQVTDSDNNSTKTRTLKTTLDKYGKAKIKIDSLESGTSYSFKIKIKSTSDSSYSGYSESASVATKSSGYSTSIKEIEDVDDNSLVLRVSCEKLSKKAVNVQVRVTNKDDDDSTTTKTYTTTLSKSGIASVTVDGLDSGTSYGFKIKIKKTTDNLYSAYSGEKTAETED